MAKHNTCSEKKTFVSKVKKLEPISSMDRSERRVSNEQRTCYFKTRYRVRTAVRTLIRYLHCTHYTV